MKNIYRLLVLIALMYLLHVNYNNIAYAQGEKRNYRIDIKRVEVDSLDYDKIVATTFVESSLSCLVNLMYDTTAYTKWLHKCKYARILEKGSEKSGFHLFIYESRKLIFIPLLKDRYFLARSAEKSHTLRHTPLVMMHKPPNTGNL